VLPEAALPEPASPQLIAAHSTTPTCTLSQGERNPFIIVESSPERVRRFLLECLV
jgi:hypothetical protein